METRFEQILAKALRNRVSDIHFVFNDNELEIQMRSIRGIIRMESEKEDLRLFNYLMYRAHLDLTSTLPQSGSFTYYYRGTYYDFRLAVILNNRMRDGVLRILNYHNGLKLDQLTFQEEIQQQMLHYLHCRSGLVIFSGLTGSGKTTTLYSLLQMLKGKSIYSLEDPIEVYQNHIIQIEMNPKAGMDYDSAIRQILRHNPDVIMIGEIRDETSARMAVRAGLTGCLVFSSVHAKNAESALHRLVDLGVSENDLKDTLLAVFNQRLVKQFHKNNYIGVYECLDNDQIVRALQGERVGSTMADALRQAIAQKQIEPMDEYG